MHPETDILFVDAHVHLHPEHSLDVFLEGACANVAWGASQMGLRQSPLGCLLFAECAWHHTFHNLLYTNITTNGATWRIEPTDEPESALAYRNNVLRLVLIAGRQIVTAERLEVLALATSSRFPDGEPIEHVLRSTLDDSAITIMPWGLGKWWGRRGLIVRHLIRSLWGRTIMLGDNGNRPQLSPLPLLMRLGRRYRMPILPGSDPLAIPSHVTRSGSYGFVLHTSLPLDRPAEHLRRVIAPGMAQPRIYGRRLSWPQFIRTNIEHRRYHYAPVPMTHAPTPI